MKDGNNIMFPTVMSVKAQTIAADLLSVIPMGYDVKTYKRMEDEIYAKNRSIQINNVLDDLNDSELKIQDHPDYNKSYIGPNVTLNYIDFKYDNTNDEET